MCGSIKNESWVIADDQTLSVQKWFKIQWTCGHLMLCVLRLTTIPKCQAPYQKDSNEGDEDAGSCEYACKAQASARVDVPTAPEVVPRDLRQCAHREGLEVRLSREWVRAFLVSISLQHNDAAYPHQCRDQTDAARGVGPHSYSLAMWG